MSYSFIAPFIVRAFLSSILISSLNHGLFYCIAPDPNFGSLYIVTDFQFRFIEMEKMPYMISFMSFSLSFILQSGYSLSWWETRVHRRERVFRSCCMSALWMSINSSWSIVPRAHNLLSFHLPLPSIAGYNLSFILLTFSFMYFEIVLVIDTHMVFWNVLVTYTLPDKSTLFTLALSLYNSLCLEINFTLC